MPVSLVVALGCGGQAKKSSPEIHTWSQAALRARIHQAWQCSDQGIHVDLGGSSRPGDPPAQGVSYAAGSSARRMVARGPSTRGPSARGPSADRQGKTCAEHYRDALCAEIARGADATEDEERLCNRR